MSLPVYPTLSINPRFPIITEPVWDTSIVNYEGKVEQREANRNIIKLRFYIDYRIINTKDRELLEGFFEIVRGKKRKFSWTNPEDDAVYTVKFEDKKLDIDYFRYELWNIKEFKLIEAL
ncbi:MAG: DUF2460 domain-containing protein [Candidatus Asgardarchaeia archaeon]